jgi:DNA-binding NarL/FixJ family response regulator
VSPPTPLRPRRPTAAALGSGPLVLLAPPSSAPETFLSQLLEELDTLPTPVVLVVVTRGEDRSAWVPDAAIASRLHLAGGESAASTGRTAAPLGSLTEREHTVLHYPPSLMTYEEIASDLYVSVNTVKSHVSGIFRKLGVGGRRQAVRTARELHLL